MAGYKSVGERNVAKVLSFPALKAIPAPSLPLKGVAYDKYLEIAQKLLAGGKLNTHTKSLCEQIGVIHSEQYRRLEHNLQVPQTSFARLEKLLKELRLIDDSDEAAPKESRSENRFSRFGVITRRGAKKAELRTP